MILVTIVAGVVGSLIAKAVKMPVPFMIGAMIGVALLNVLTAKAYLPANTKVITQSLTGVFIGLTLKKSDLAKLKDLIKPLMVMMFGFMLFTLILGSLFYYVFKFDAPTSFLIAIPGGVTEIALIAPEFGADGAVVSFLQTFRLFSVYLFFPAIIKAVSKRVETQQEETEEVVVENRETFIDRIMPKNEFLQQLITAIIGVIGGYLGKISGFPAGTLAGSLILVILFQFNCMSAHLERKYKKYVQIFAGALVGSSITKDTILHLYELIIPTIVLIVMYVLADFVLSYFMTKTKKIDYISAMFATAPGGASDMALVAGEIGSDSPKIAVLHMIRLISCYTIFPIWAKFLISIVGK